MHTFICAVAWSIPIMVLDLHGWDRAWFSIAGFIYTVTLLHKVEHHTHEPESAPPQRRAGR